MVVSTTTAGVVAGVVGMCTAGVTGAGTGRPAGLLGSGVGTIDQRALTHSQSYA